MHVVRLVVNTVDNKFDCGLLMSVVAQLDGEPVGVADVHARRRGAGRHDVMDLVFVGIAILFFAFSRAFVRLAGKL